MGVETQPPSILERVGTFANRIAQKIEDNISLGLQTTEGKLIAAGIGTGAFLATTAADGPGKALVSCFGITGLFVLSGYLLVRALDRRSAPPQDPPTKS